MIRSRDGSVCDRKEGYVAIKQTGDEGDEDLVLLTAAQCPSVIKELRHFRSAKSGSTTRLPDPILTGLAAVRSHRQGGTGSRDHARRDQPV
jgi:hypothetical protein